MKRISIFALLALIPLFSSTTPSLRHQDIFGLWEDYNSGIALHIKPAKRNGLLVKRLDRNRRSNWIRYDRVGRNSYDDCNGHRLKVTSRGLKWYRPYGRAVYLDKAFIGRRHRSRDYDRIDPYDDGYSRTYIRPNGLGGEWYCTEYGASIFIETFRDGIKVRRTDRGGTDRAWYEYLYDRNYDNRLSGRNGSYYEILDDRQIIFHDLKRGKRLRFRRT